MRRAEDETEGGGRASPFMHFEPFTLWGPSRQPLFWDRRGKRMGVTKKEEEGSGD